MKSEVVKILFVLFEEQQCIDMIINVLKKYEYGSQYLYRNSGHRYRTMKLCHCLPMSQTKSRELKKWLCVCVRACVCVRVYPMYMGSGDLTACNMHSSVAKNQEKVIEFYRSCMESNHTFNTLF